MGKMQTVLNHDRNLQIRTNHNKLRQAILEGGYYG